MLNATQDSLPTPSRLKCWRQSSAGDGKCPLGCGRAGTLKHILCTCCKAIAEKPQSRITWRHDSTLLTIYRGITERVEAAMKAGKKCKVDADPIQFKSHGNMSPEQKLDEEPQLGCQSSSSHGTRFVASRKPASWENVLESASVNHMMFMRWRPTPP